MQEADVARYVLTGAPGAGKTAILRLLERAGHRVVEEAATDVIALEQALGRLEPSTRAGFTDMIAALQRQREIQAGGDGAAASDGAGAIFFDRSPVCTLALSRYLGSPVSALLAAEVERVVRNRVYAAVFFVRNQGFVEPTAARRISFGDSLVFEKVHEQVYRELGFELIDVPAGPLEWRAELVCAAAGLPAPLDPGGFRARTS
ncbi:MAG TPA: AAA family ATPase [Streptosporangiaceae bacterium]